MVVVLAPEIAPSTSAATTGWSTTCSTHRRPLRCRRIIRHRIMDGCSIIRRRQASASSASACSPAARCRDRGRAASDCEPAARTNRLGYDLQCRRRTSTSSDAAGQGWVCRESDRSRHKVCALTSGDEHHSGWYGNAAAIRGCARCGRKRPAAAPRASPAVNAAASIRRRTTLIAEPADRGPAIRWQARANILSRIGSPSALAVLRLMINSSFVACWTGKSAGFSPLRMRPT